MTAVPPPTPPQPAQPNPPAPAQYQPFLPPQPQSVQQPGIVYPGQQTGASNPAPTQGYAQPANPQFPNGAQGSAYRPSEGLQARVRGNYRWAFFLFALPGIIGIPIFIALLIWANITYRQ